MLRQLKQMTSEAMSANANINAGNADEIAFLAMP
jgi:hypothetical protein